MEALHEAKRKHKSWNIHEKGKNKKINFFNDQQTLVDSCHEVINTFHQCVKKNLPPDVSTPTVPWEDENCTTEEYDMFRCLANCHDETKNEPNPKEAVIKKYGEHIQQIMRTANAVGFCKPLDKMFR